MLYILEQAAKSEGEGVHPVQKHIFLIPLRAMKVVWDEVARTECEGEEEKKRRWKGDSRACQGRWSG